MATTDLALTRPDPTMDRDSLKLMMDQAIRYVESGLLPNAIKTPQQALIIMIQGRELGIPATYALRNIAVVNGKPTCSAELMLALVQERLGQAAMRVAKTDNESCTVQYRQTGWDGVSEYSFSLDDAKRAGLLKNPVWNQYPAAMLRARCISAVIRFAFPGVIAGLSTPEEMGASVSVVDGEVVPGGPAERERCDADHWNKAWHAAVKGSRFADDDTRHKFVAWFTENRVESLTAFLEDATTDEASGLISAVERRIVAEAKKARDLLISQAKDAVEQAQRAGVAFDVPDDLTSLSDTDLRGLIDLASAAIENAEAVSA